MAENTKIEWADHTWNPWEGCQKVGPGCDHCYADTRNARLGDGQAVNWGPGARPMHPDRASSLRDQCNAAGVPFLFKQWGEWLPAKEGRSITGKTLVLEGAAPFTSHSEWHAFPDGQQLARIGKKATGRLLDGRTWDGVPAP